MAVGLPLVLLERLWTSVGATWFIVIVLAVLLAVGYSLNRLFRSDGGFWRAIAHASADLSSRDSELAKLMGATPREFERLVGQALSAKGYDVTHTPVTGDQGADLILRLGGQSIAVECKKYKGSVGNSAVQQVIAARTFYGTDEAWVVTTGQFTRSAKELAAIGKVKLLDGGRLKTLFEPGQVW